MKVKVYRAKLHIRGKNIYDIKTRFEGEGLTEKELNKWLEDCKLVDGTEVIIAKGPDNDSDYSLIGWDQENDDKWRDYIYTIEQDPYFGTYIDSWDKFVEDWNNDDYSPSGSLVIHDNDVEIIEEIKWGGACND